MRIADMRLGLLSLLVFTCSAATKPNTEELKGQADAILARDAIQARQDVGIVFEAADGLADAGRLGTETGTQLV